MARYADTSAYTEAEQTLWNHIIEHQGQTLLTVNGLPFTYTIRGNELIISRKEKSIPRSSVNLALSKIAEQPEKITGPKKLGVFGASYLYSIFLSIGVLAPQ